MKNLYKVLGTEMLTLTLLYCNKDKPQLEKESKLELNINKAKAESLAIEHTKSIDSNAKIDTSYKANDGWYVEVKYEKFPPDLFFINKKGNVKEIVP